MLYLLTLGITIVISIIVYAIAKNSPYFLAFLNVFSAVFILVDVFMKAYGSQIVGSVKLSTKPQTIGEVI